MKIVKRNEKRWLKRKGYSKRILFTEDELKSRGLLVQIVKSEAHTEIKPHYHKKTIETYYILKGKAILFCGDKRFRARKGDAFLCEPGEVHGVINDTDEEFLLLVFKINAKENDSYWVK
ncbi:cupin domain-containing protein [Candidatus Bathyarchaeota archaeon]|nr:cupin domain-containing protein [Candidatus Bathyarchaeota archaeon]